MRKEPCRATRRWHKVLKCSREAWGVGKACLVPSLFEHVFLALDMVLMVSFRFTGQESGSRYSEVRL